MKCVIHEGSRIVLEDSAPLSPTAGECVFSVRAAGVCGSDLPRAFSGGAYHYPLVVGHEFAGVVKASTKPSLVGRRACVFPILPCGTCEFCAREQWANCKNYDYYGSRRDGGMQSELLVREENLIFLPDHVSYEAAAMVEPAAVCLHAVKKAQITPASRVLVYGAGTIGMLSAMWARALGAALVAVSDIDDARLRAAEELGFSRHTGGTYDLIIEASGAPEALLGAIENASAFGKILLVGHGKRDTLIPHTAFVQILRKQLSLFGSWNSDRASYADDWQDAIDAIAAGRIDPTRLITHRVPLSDAPRAFTLAAGRQERSNKVMVVNSDEE